MIQTKGSLVKKLKPGDRALVTRTFTESESMMFVALSGDHNPHHTDAGFCALTRFEKPIVPGFFVAAMATHIGGQWAVLASQFHLNFLAPVFIGDTITCEAVVETVDEKYMVKVDFTCANQDGSAVIKGWFKGYPPSGERLEYLFKSRTQAQP